jgi:hypothetical protein
VVVHASTELGLVEQRLDFLQLLLHRVPVFLKLGRA